MLSPEMKKLHDVTVHPLRITHHAPRFLLRQRSLQYTTSSHTRSHFLRHVNGRPQTGHTFVGKSRFLGDWARWGFMLVEYSVYAVDSVRSHAKKELEIGNR